MNKDSNNTTVNGFTVKKYSLSSNPFEVVACTSSDQYVERENELKDFESNLRLIISSGFGCKGKKIIGCKGIGKTSLVNMYFEIAHKKGLKRVYATVSNTAQNFMRNLLIGAINAETDEYKRNSFSKRYGEFVRRKSADSDDLFRKFTEIIDELQPKPVIVAIDETIFLPRMINFSYLFNNYVFDHAHDVMFILCLSPDTYKKIVETAFSDRFPEVIRLPSFSDDELREVLKKRLSVVRTGAVSSPYFPFTKKAVETLLDHAGGVPRYLIEIANSSLGIGVESQTPSINEETVNKAAVRAERGYLVSIWHSLNSFEKQTLIEITRMGGKVKLNEIIDAVKKERSWVWRSVNELVERGLVEKMGEAKKDVTYKLITDPKLIMDLKNKEGKNT